MTLARQRWLAAGLAGALWLALPAPAPGEPATRAKLPETQLGLTARVFRLRAPGSLMVRIAAGPAVIGSTSDEVIAAAAQCAREPLAYRCNEATFGNELGRHTPRLPSFFIDRTEVRVQDYARCVAAGRCEAPGYTDGGERFRKPDYPAAFVAWDQARDYCRFRGARLPTELEYERAARGAAGRAYPWGNTFNARVANHGRFGVLANDDGDGHAELAPVASYPEGRTPDGILDLAGNVAEWQADPYRESYSDPPPDAGDVARRVIRGGSFMSGAAWLRGAARDAATENTQRPDLGFRCARSAEPTPP